MKKFLLLIIISVSFCAGQSKDPNAIINNVKETFKKVKDYTADVDIIVDVSYLKVPRMNAKIYFKQPDLIHIESNGFAMLPKDGLYTSPLSLLNGDYTAIFVKDENIDGHNTSVVKIIPLNEKGNVVLSTLWIDQSLNVIRKVESTTKTNGTFTLALGYGNNKYPLPDKMEFVFNAERMKFPQMQMDEENIDREKEKRNLSGKVVITYSNYSVNKGIPDSVFKKPNKGLSE